MKKIKILGLIVALIITLFGCEELPDPAGVRGVGIVPGIEDLDPGLFDSKNLATTFIEFTASIPEGTTADKITIVCTYNGNNVETTITEITSFPSVVRITAADAAQKMGISLSDVANGDIFTFILLPTVKGITYHSSAVIIVPVACAYDVNLATGSYHFISPGWQTEGDITLTADPDNEYKIFVSGLEEPEGLTEDLGPLVMYINPANYSVNVPRKAIASDAWGLYHNLAYEGTGTYSSCNGSYSMSFTISVDEGTFTGGPFGFTFTKK